MKPRFGSFHFAGLLVRERERMSNALLCDRGFARRILGPSARIERCFLENVESTASLAVAMCCAAGCYLDLFGPLPRVALFPLETLGFGTQALGLHAPFGFTRGVLRTGCFDFTQVGKDRLEFAARLRQRRLSLKLLLARSLYFRSER
jgi:hypothetical protein